MTGVTCEIKSGEKMCEGDHPQDCLFFDAA